MAEDKDLNLALNIKKDAARAAVASFRADLHRQQAEILSDAQAAERAKVEAARRANREKIQDIARTIKTEGDLRKEAAAAEAARVKQEARDARAASKEAAAAAREAAKEKAALGDQDLARRKRKFREELDALKQTWGEEKIGQRDVIEEGKRLAAELAAAEKKAHDQAVAGSMLAFKEQAKLNAGMVAGQRKVEDFGASFLKLQVITQVAGWIREAMQTIGASIQSAREHIKGLVAEMESARTASRELAALRGEKATGAFTAQIAREAAGTGLDTEEYKQFQLGFQAQAGQYIGAAEATPEELAARGKPLTGAPDELRVTPEELAAKGKKLTDDQALDLQRRVASYSMGARGLSAEDSSRLLGTVIAKSKAGVSNDEIMSQYAKLMKIAELAPGRTSPMLGQISELGMESVGEQGDFTNLQQAAYLTRVMAQRNPAEASTYGRAMLRGLRDISGDQGKHGDERRAELGITKGMDVMQMLNQVDIKAREHTARGGNEGEFIQKYFPEIREFGSIRTALNEGIRGGGFKRAELEAASVNAGTAQADTNRYMAGEEGVRARQRSEQLAAERESAARYAPLRQIQADQKAVVASSHLLEKPEGLIGAMLTNAGTAFGQGSRETQEINKLTARNIENRLSSYAEGKRYLKRKFGSEAYLVGSETHYIKGSTSEDKLADAAQELKRLADAAEARRDQPTPRVNPPQDRGGVRQ